MQVLVDSAVWIDYFKGGQNSDELDFLIGENIVVINDLILAELTPYLKLRGEKKIIELLKAVKRLDLDIEWNQIIDYQYECLREGINGIGLPDLILVQNAKQNNCSIYSLDQHFDLVNKVIDFEKFE